MYSGLVCWTYQASEGHLTLRRPHNTSNVVREMQGNVEHILLVFKRHVRGNLYAARIVEVLEGCVVC